MSYNAIVLAIIIVVILIITWVMCSKRMAVEHFAGNTNGTLNNGTLRALQQTFNVGSCSILAAKTGDARMISTDFLTNKRLKEWKPKQTIDTDKYSYCYINNDVSNKTQDYIMSEEPCDTTNKTFDGVPFVVDVFPHDIPEYTQMYPNKKCVVKINNALVTDENVNDFWTNRIGASDCIQKNRYVLELNENLIKEKSEKSRYLNMLGRKITARKTDTIEKTAYLSKITADYNNCLAAVDYLKKDVIKTDATIVYWENQTKALAEYCVTTQTQLTDLIKQCQIDFAGAQDALAKKTEERDQFAGVYATTVSQLDTMLVTLQNVVMELSRLNDRLEVLKTDVNKKTAEYAICEDSLLKCRQNLQATRDKIVDLNAGIQDLTNKLNACGRMKRDCDNNSRICGTARDGLWTGYIGFDKQNKICVTDMTNLKSTHGNLQWVTQDHDRYITWLRARPPKEDCEPVKIEVNSLVARKTELLEICQREKAADFAGDYTKLSSQTQGNMTNAFNACFDNIKGETEAAKKSAKIRVAQAAAVAETAAVAVATATATVAAAAVLPQQYHMKLKFVHSWTSGFRGSNTNYHNYWQEAISPISMADARSIHDSVTHGEDGNYDESSKQETINTSKEQAYPEATLVTRGYRNTSYVDG